MSKQELMRHRKIDHPRVIKMCRYFLQGNCAYKNDICWYNHDNLIEKEFELNHENNDENKFNCRFCDKTFSLKEHFMIHKKADHIQAVPKCRKFMKGDCKLKSDQCWYTHDKIKSVKMQEKNQENLDFHKDPEHRQPPDLM